MDEIASCQKCEVCMYAYKCAFFPQVPKLVLKTVEGKQKIEDRFCFMKVVPCPSRVLLNTYQALHFYLHWTKDSSWYPEQFSLGQRCYI